MTDLPPLPDPIEDEIPSGMTNDEFRRIREELGLTQAQLARVLGYGANVRISEFETERREIPLHVAMLMEAFKAGYRPDNWPA